MGWEEALLYVACLCGVAFSLACFIWGRGIAVGRNVPATVRDDSAFAGILTGPVAAGEIILQADSPRALLDLLVLGLENPFQTTQHVWARAGSASSQIQVLRTDEHELSFAGKNMLIGEGLVRAETQAPGTVRVRWALQVPGAKLFVRLGQLWALGLGCTASIIVPFLLVKYVAHSLNPAIHGQIVQVVQIVQVLWEPILFIGLARQRLNAAGKQLETTIAAAAYELRTGRPPQPLSK